MVWKFPNRLEKRSGEDNVNGFTETVNWFTGNICNRRISKAAADHGNRKNKQWRLELSEQNDCVTPACFPLSKAGRGFYHLFPPSMGRRTVMRRTLSPTREATLTTSTLISSAGRFSS